SYDPRYFTTYYALDGINFTPKDVSSALDRLEAPYLPIVVQEAAGLPLDPSFAEQKKILERCHGLFFQCAGGAEARRFNRLLLNVTAGLFPPSQGRVEIFGASLPGLNRQAGYLFQSDSLFPWKTALENVAIGLEIAGTPRDEARGRAQQWLTRVGLGSFGPRY